MSQSRCYSVKRFPKIAPNGVTKNCSPKLIPKAPLQGCSTMTILQTYSTKRLHQSGSQKVGSRKLLPKIAAESCSPKLRPEWLPKPAPQSCSPKPLPKVVIATCSGQLPPKVVSESCFPKLLSKATPQSCRSSKKTVRQCCCKAAKLLPTVASKSSTESRGPKKLLETPKLLPEAASKLVRKAVPP